MEGCLVQKYNNQRHYKSQATQRGCLSSLLEDGDKVIEIVYGEENIFCIGPTRPAKEKNLL
jgi:hypothetical protein